MQTTSTLKKKVKNKTQPLISVKQTLRSRIDCNVISDFTQSTSTLKKDSLVSFTNPSFSMSSVKQLLKLISLIKNEKEFNETFHEEYKLNSILIYSDSKFKRQMLSIALKKYCELTETKFENNIIQIGGIKELIKSKAQFKKYNLIIFTEKPIKSNLRYCISNQMFLISIFNDEKVERLEGVYNVPLQIHDFKSYFWLVTLLNSV